MGRGYEGIGERGANTSALSRKATLSPDRRWRGAPLASRGALEDMRWHYDDHCRKLGRNETRCAMFRKLPVSGAHRKQHMEDGGMAERARRSARRRPRKTRRAACGPGAAVGLADGHPADGALRTAVHQRVGFL